MTFSTAECLSPPVVEVAVVVVDDGTVNFEEVAAVSGSNLQAGSAEALAAVCGLEQP